MKFNTQYILVNKFLEVVCFWIIWSITIIDYFEGQGPMVRSFCIVQGKFDTFSLWEIPRVGKLLYFGNKCIFGPILYQQRVYLTPPIDGLQIWTVSRSLMAYLDLSRSNNKYSCWTIHHSFVMGTTMVG